jgi:hypothetical protein
VVRNTKSLRGAKSAAGAVGFPPMNVATVPSIGAAEVATTRSPRLIFVVSAPVVPTRTSCRPPRRMSSSHTTPIEGPPMPVVWTLTGRPLTVPV